jgi:aerobic C4-dicarboxylate transport protein
VTGSGFIVLASTLAAMRVVPVEGVAILLGVDRFMSEARAITNLIGNGAATLVIARSENAYVEPVHESNAVLLRTPYDDVSGPTYQPHE